MIQSLDSLRSWLLQAFGTSGAVVIASLAFLLCLAWLMTPISVWCLYRKSRTLERYLIELRDRTAILSRQQQVERLKRDKSRKKTGRRR